MPSRHSLSLPLHGRRHFRFPGETLRLPLRETKRAGAVAGLYNRGKPR
jgi:hypothetical protein